MQLMNTVVEIFFCYILVYFFAFYNSDSHDIIDPLNEDSYTQG